MKLRVRSLLGFLLVLCLCLALFSFSSPRAAAETGIGTCWYAVEKQTAPSPWFRFNGYVDTMNPAAIRDFIREKTNIILEEAR